MFTPSGVDVFHGWLDSCKMAKGSAQAQGMALLILAFYLLGWHGLGLVFSPVGLFERRQIPGRLVSRLLG